MREAIAGTVERLFAKMDGAIYNATDKDAFITAFCNLLNAVACGEDKALKAKTSRICDALKLKTARALTDSAGHTVEALEALLKQAKGELPALKASTVFKSKVLDITNSSLRDELSLDQIENKMREMQVEEWAPRLRQFFDIDDLEKAAKLMENLRSIGHSMVGFGGVVASLAVSNRGGDEEQKKAALKKGMDHMAGLKNLVQSLHGDLQQDAMLRNVDELETALGLKTVGAESYKTSLAAFKEEARRLCDIALGAEDTSLADDNDRLKTFKMELEAWEESIFPLKQLANFSECAEHDRAAIDAGKSYVSLCAHAHQVSLSPEKAEEEIGAVPPELQNTMASILGDVSSTRPTLFWLIGCDETCNKFMDFARKLYNVVTPLTEKQVKTQKSRTQEALKVVTTLLLDETKGRADETKFMNFYNAGKVNTMHKNRAALKATFATAKETCKALGDGLSEALVKACTDAIETSRLHQIKFGLFSLTRHPAAAKLDKTGEDIRTNLKAAWECHNGDDNLKEYLGPELVQLVTTTLEIANPAEDAAKAVINKKRQGSNGGIGAGSKRSKSGAA